MDGGDDLHSIAFTSRSNSSSSSTSIVGGNFDDLGVLNADMSSQTYYMENDYNNIRGSAPALYSSFEADHYDLSTGYLEDVLFDFSSKRRRLLLFAQDQTKPYDDHSQLKNCWTSNFVHNCCQDFDTLSQITKCDTISNTKAATISETYDSSSSPSASNKDTRWNTPESLFSSEANKKKTGKKRVLNKVVYPFAMVKPGGFEGDATLNDINERILMPPTRPVRHPVGDFACRPLVSPDGPGLSGKTVVAFTRVQTQGKGTITIIRTRG